MKPLKSKKAMVASIILASVALGGVGFSAWVINAGNDIEEPKNVSVEVGKSTDNRFTLTPPQLAEDEKVVFDFDRGFCHSAFRILCIRIHDYRRSQWT